MDGFSRGAVAVAAGYLLAFYVAADDLYRTSWVVPAIGASGALAAAAGIRAFPRALRVIFGAASTVGFSVLGVIGIPVTVGLLLGAVLVGGGTMSLFDARRETPSSDVPAR
jgi:hypothetical protein